MSNTDDIGFLGVTVESVEFIDLDEPSPVFDIEVETDHSFIVSGVVAHNCTTCAPLDGLEWTKERQAIGHKFPYPNYPKHFNCLTGDALVSTVGDVTGVSKRWFDGEIVVITTAAGKKLTCTPNHPILTSSGWIAAGELNVGGDVIRDGFSQGEAIANGNHENVITTIHDFVEAFASSGGVGSIPVPLSSSDFHGDGGGSKIAVVHSKRFLGDGFDSASSKHLGKSSLIGRLSNFASSFFSGSSLLKAFNGALRTPYSSLRLKSILTSLLWGKVAHSCKLLISAVSSRYSGVPKCSCNYSSGHSDSFSHARDADATLKQLSSLFEVDLNLLSGGVDSSISKVADNDVNAYAKLSGELLAGSSGAVFADKIVDIQASDFSGHVYNLETDKGWYVANGIITHNCRCLLIPVVLDGPQGGERASDDGLVSADTTFSGWLKRQPIAKQDEILGKGRATLYRDGKITLSDLVRGNGSPLTLNELRSKYS